MATVDDFAIAPLSREQMDREAAILKPAAAPQTVQSGNTPALRPASGQAQQNPFTSVLLGEKSTADLNEVTGGGIRGQQGSGRVVDNYSELQRFLEDDIRKSAIPTQEQMQRAARRHRSRQIVNSVADAGRALANLFATTEYAPNGYTPGQGLSEQQQARYDRLVTQNEAARQQHQNNLLMLGKLRDNREARAAARDKAAAEQANARAMMQLRLAEFELARAKDKRDAELHALDLQLKAGEIDAAEAKARTAKTEADYAEKQQQANLALTDARTSQARAAANKSSAEAGAVAQDGFPAHDRYGNIHYFKSQEAAEAFARSEGTWKLYARTEVEKQTGGDGGNKTIIRSGIAGGYSQAPAGNKGIMPGVGGSNNNNETKMPGIR